MLESLIISIQIARPFAEAYAHAAEPANWPAWASGLGDAFRPLANGEWAASTPGGEARIRFTEPNPYGVLDHTVTTPDGSLVRVPLWMTANDDGVVVLFTLFRQPGMTDAQFAADAAQVRRDLLALKAVLEGTA